MMDAGKLLERGKLIDIRPHTRFIRFPAHSHNYVEMIYMCQGSTVHTINGDLSLIHIWVGVYLRVQGAGNFHGLYCAFRT